jgi:hypothetical protein
MSAAALSIAILLCNPMLNHGTASSYGRMLDSESISHGFDGMTAASLICHESGWRAGAVSPDGEDYGLGQLRARYIGKCAGDFDPVRAPSPGCVATKAMLLDGATNIRLVADHIMRWKRLCRTRSGSGAAKHWLTGYGGLSRPSLGEWCGRRRSQGRWVEVVHHKVKEILSIRRRLARGLPPRPQARSR